MSNKSDDSLVKSFKFNLSTVEKMQSWIDKGYFEDDADIAFNAYQIIFKVMELIEKDQKVIDFNTVSVGIEIDVPIVSKQYILQ